MTSHVCLQCSKKFSSKFSLWGHKSKCRKSSVFKLVTLLEKLVKVDEEAEETKATEATEASDEEAVETEQDEFTGELADEFTDIPSPTTSLDAVEPRRYTVDKSFYQFQKGFFRKVDLSTSHPVKLVSGNYMAGNKRTYLRLLEYVVNAHGVSDRSANELIRCIKSISVDNGKEIPLPSRFERITSILLDPIKDLKARITTKSIPFPVELMGPIAGRLKPAKTIILNILDVIASMLVDKDIVGERRENFHETFSYRYNENGTRVFSDPSTGMYILRPKMFINLK